MADDPQVEILEKVEDLSAVPELLHRFYVEDEDGGFRLDDPTQLKSSLQHARQERDRAKKAVAEAKRKADKQPMFSEEDLEEFEKLKTEAEAREHETAAKKGEFDKLAVKLEEKHTRELGLKQAENDSLRAALNGEMIDAKLTQALAAAKATSDGIELLPERLKERVRVVEESGRYQTQVLDADGQQDFNADAQPKTIENLVAEAREKYGVLFMGTGATGGGAVNSASGGGAPPPKSKPYAEMTPFDKSAYIAEHGIEAFGKLADLNVAGVTSTNEREARPGEKPPG